MSDAPKPHARVRVAAIILDDGQVLLARHAKDDREYYLLPGGGVEVGETLADALTREVLEETGLRIRVGDLVFVNDSIAPESARHIVNLCFTAEYISGELRAGTDGRLVAVEWQPVENLANLPIYPDIGKTLLAMIRAGFPDHAPYVGNIWT